MRLRSRPVSSPAPNRFWKERLFPQASGLSVCVGSGIRAAVNGQIRPGNV